MTLTIQDVYSGYEELKQHEQEGADYLILFREGSGSGIALMAPHGGGIEPGTVEIADAIARDEHAFYAFKGMKKRGNSVLHVTSNRFDEPIGVRIAAQAERVITFHGYHGAEDWIYIGGRNTDAMERIRNHLTDAGFHAEISLKPGLRAISPDNICNRCRSGKGVQLEISRGVREKMFENLPRRSHRTRTRLFYRFTDTLIQAIRH